MNVASHPPPVDKAAPLLEVSGLVKRFDISLPWIVRVLRGKPREWVHAVDDVSFTIAPGKTLSLVGESGCGKSTTARCLAGLQTATAGDVRFRGIPIAEIARTPKHPYMREIQMVFQDPYGSLNPRWRVGRIVADPIRALGLAKSRREVKEEVIRLLEAVGLTAADADKFPHEFSGGQRQRVAIARALSSRPSFIICDEPTSALDVSVQAQILNLMLDLQAEFGLTYLFISHNLAVVEQMSDDVGVMYLGHLVEFADSVTLFEHPLHPYTRQLISAIPAPDRIGQRPKPMIGEVPSAIAPPPGCPFHPRCEYAVDLCRVERPALRKYGSALVACHRAEEVRELQ